MADANVKAIKQQRPLLPALDPIGVAGGINFYAYVRNNPVNWIDPWGLKYAESWGAGGAAVGGSIVIGGSIVVDVATGGLNILATPAEVSGGMALGGAVGYGIGSLLDWVLNENTSGDNDPQQCPSDGRNPSQDKKLAKGDIKKLQDNDIDPEELKGGVHTGQWDLFKDRNGNIYIKPKNGAGTGDPTGININDL